MLTSAKSDGLKDAIDSGIAVFLAGSAISMGWPTCAPSASSIVSCAMDALSTGCDFDVLDLSKAKQSQFEGMFSRLFRSIGKDASLAIIETLAPSNLGRAHVPNGIHRALREYSLRHSQPLLTTNYDDFIEHGTSLCTVVGEDSMMDAARRLRADRKLPLLMKLHGDVFDRQSQVVAIDQTSRNVSIALRDSFLQAVDGQVLCAIGYSGLDVDIYPLLLQANWEAVYWLVKPGQDIEPRLRRLFEVAHLRGKLAAVIPVDLFTEDLPQLLCDDIDVVPLDAATYERYCQACTDFLVERWQGIDRAHRSGAMALILENCGCEREALKYLDDAEDDLHGLFLLGAEASGYHATGQFKQMARAIRRRVKTRGFPPLVLDVARTQVASAAGECTRMSMGQPSYLVFISLLPYFVPAIFLLFWHFRDASGISHRHRHARDEMAVYQANAGLDMWIRLLTVRMFLLDMLHDRALPLLRILPILNPKRIEGELAEIEQIANEVGLRDIALNASRYTRRLRYILDRSSVDDAVTIAEYAAEEYRIIVRPLGDALEGRDAARASARAGDLSTAYRQLRRAIGGISSIYPGAAGGWLTELSDYAAQLGKPLRAARLRRVASRLLWSVEGFGNKVQAIRACLSGAISRNP